MLPLLLLLLQSPIPSDSAKVRSEKCARCSSQTPPPLFSFSTPLERYRFFRLCTISVTRCCFRSSQSSAVLSFFLSLSLSLSYSFRLLVRRVIEDSSYVSPTIFSYLCSRLLSLADLFFRFFRESSKIPFLLPPPTPHTALSPAN